MDNLKNHRRKILCRQNQRNSKWPQGQRLAAKRGERKKSSLRGASKGMYESMSKAELRRMAKTKQKGKPTRKKKKR